MTTINSILLDIVSIILSIFFLLGIGLMIYIWIALHRLIKKAEEAINSVETASNFIREIGHQCNMRSITKIFKFIMKNSKK